MTTPSIRLSLDAVRVWTLFFYPGRVPAPETASEVFAPSRNKRDIVEGCYNLDDGALYCSLFLSCRMFSRGLSDTLATLLRQRCISLFMGADSLRIYTSIARAIIPLPVLVN